MKGCLVYDKNNDCTKCSPGYQLKNGICDGTIITIVTIVVLSITVIAFLIFIVYIIFNDIGIFECFNDKETFEKFYGKEQKCILCKEIVTKVSLLKYECGICLELKHHTYHLNCGCNFELCANCYNKMRTTKLCPGCRKPFDSYIPIIRNSSSK